MSKTHQGNSQKTSVAPLLDFQRGLHTSNSHKKNTMGPDDMFIVSQDLFFVRKIAKFRAKSLRAKVTSRIAPDSAFSSGKWLEVSSKHRCCQKKKEKESRWPESDFPSTIFITKFLIFSMKSLSPNSTRGNCAQESVGALVSCNRNMMSSSCDKKKIGQKIFFIHGEMLF